MLFIASDFFLLVIFGLGVKNWLALRKHFLHSYRTWMHVLSSLCECHCQRSLNVNELQHPSIHSYRVPLLRWNLSPNHYLWALYDTVESAAFSFSLFDTVEASLVSRVSLFSPPKKSFSGCGRCQSYKLLWDQFIPTWYWFPYSSMGCQLDWESLEF